MTVLMRDLSPIRTFFLQAFWRPRRALEISLESKSPHRVVILWEVALHECSNG